MNKKTNLTPIISVIIPTYNDIKHVTRAIDSVINQNIQNVQIIVVDDASTDNTTKILKKKYSKKITIIQHKANQKLGAARNTGIDMANGKYIFFLDSDDWLDPNALEKLLSIAEKNISDVTAFGVNTVSESGKKKLFHSIKLKTVGGIRALKYYSTHKIGSIVWNKLYLTNLIKINKIRFVSPYLHEDVNFTLQVLFYAKRYISIAKPYYNYFQRDNSIVNGMPTLLHLKSYIRLFLDMNNFITKKGFNKNDELRELASNLIKAHCLDANIPNIIRYRKLKSSIEWKNDLYQACVEEIDKNFFIPFSLIENIAKQISQYQENEINIYLPSLKKTEVQKRKIEYFTNAYHLVQTELQKILPLFTLNKKQSIKYVHEINKIKKQLIISQTNELQLQNTLQKIYNSRAWQYLCQYYKFRDMIFGK